MKIRIKAMIFLLCFSNMVAAQRITEQIDSIVNAYHQSNPQLGISVGFIHQNQEYYTAYGNLSRESEIAINKNSVFEIASVTKAITGNLIAQATMEGKFTLDDFIDDYLPEIFVLQPTLKQKIKISDLASHQSGLPDIDFRALIAQNPQQPVSSVTKETLVKMINTAEELSDYGSYRYSTMGYALLGQLLEKAYGKSYDEVLAEKVIYPQQLSSTYIKNDSLAYKTTGYNPEGGEQEFFEWNVMASAGLVKSNATDMITYLKQVLDTESRLGKAALASEHAYFSKGGRKIGLGIGILEDEGQTLYLKSGDSMGQSSMLCYNRDKDWGIMILLNLRNSKLRGELLNSIYETVLR